MRIDLHTHSDVSDGTDGPAELVAAASRAGLDVVALTDHDTMAGLAQARVAGRVARVTVLGGFELTCEHDGETVHLLGYGCDANHAPLADAMAALREGRRLRVPRMVEGLNGAGVGIAMADVLAQAQPGTTLGRPHVADALVARGYVTSRQQAFDEWLDVGRPGYVEHPRLALIRGIDLVKAAGGAAVLAHPWGRESRRVLPGTVIAGLGVDGIEVDHQLHDAPTRAALREIASELGLIATGSSDYHGRGKTGHDLGCNLTSEAGYRAILALIEARKLVTL